jgi:hypothetical protein
MKILPGVDDSRFSPGKVLRPPHELEACRQTRLARDDINQSASLVR